jgi:hypothetical protein
MWTAVSSSVPHFLQVGLLNSPIIYKCLLKVLYPVRRPITTLDCVLLKDNNRALVASSGPEINSVYYKDHATIPNAGFPSSISSFFLCSAYRPPRKALSNKPLNRAVPCELVGDFNSSHSGMPRDPVEPHSMSGRDIIQPLLALSYQGRRCFDSLNRFQSRLLKLIFAYIAQSTEC